MSAPAFDFSAPAAPPAKKKRNVKKFIVPTVTAVAGLILGASFGGAGSSSENAELTAQVAELEQTNAAMDERLGALESIQDEYDALDAEHADTVAALSEAEDSTADLTARVSELEGQAADLTSQLDAKTAEYDELASQPVAAAPAPEAPAPEAAAPPVAEEPVQQSAYYENCTAARNAGAAPVRVGDPGYGSHLDRDGDGIGCE
ncbi:excalibur calcium-binding domain-containing protein [Microbacterium oryzae]|uniref:excalibur calcium-binding domain-containing protein n=1 Tax=Microbacterium oryzae TaxID=743009 RepID=UPI0025AF33A7|nr:excalibur calcium-binding domain-containing protein [Microbacterium oryzae]MDN3312177.1 excalibur calcium-binding domain-containing protein [Microbacterium oryzae]